MKFAALAESFELLEKTSSRLEMTDTLSKLLKDASPKEVDKIIYLLQGTVAPAFAGIEIGMGEKFVEEAIARASGFERRDVEKNYKETGDLGLTAEALLARRKQKSLHREELTVIHVFELFTKIAGTSGAGSQEVKLKLLSELLNSASPLEAKFLVRIPLGRLRLGIGDPTVLDALSVRTAGDKSLREPLERAYNLCSDLGLVGRVLYGKGMEGIHKFEITPGEPIRPALAERLQTAEEIIKKLGRCSIEAKYDGLRMQVHKESDKVQIFSRRLENMTHMFPEIVAAARKQVRAKDAILEGEALAYNEETGEYYPFQLTMTRKRKYEIAEKAKELPLKLFAFDMLYEDGRDMTREKYSERLKALARILAKGETIEPAERKETDNAEELQKYFDELVSRGLEGLMAKDLNAPYVAGARKFAWIKLKRSYKGELAETIDVVILGYYKGRGARVEFGFGGLLCGVYDRKEDVFKTIAKVGSGFTEEEMGKFKKMLDGIKRPSKPARADVDEKLYPDVWVEPRYVVSLKADEITRSPIHTAGREKGVGYALRFPRLHEERPDKKPEDATSVKEIRELFSQQKRVKTEEAAP